MGIRALTFATLAASTAIAVPSNASSLRDDDRPITLAPTSPWAADFAKDSCALRRQFGDGDTAVFLEIAQYGPGRTFVVTIAGKSLETTQEVARYRFLPAPASTDPGSFTLAKFGGGFRGVIFDARLEAESEEMPNRDTSANTLDLSPPKGLPPGTRVRPAIVELDAEGLSHAIGQEAPTSDADYSARARAITALKIEKALKQPVTLQTGPMLEPMRVMDDCMQNLLQAWGLKPGPDGKMPTMAEPTNAEMWAEAIMEDYPVDAMRKEISDTLRLRIMVDAEGRAESCHVQIPARHRSLEKAACRPILRLAKFEPVFDSGGTRVPSYYVTTVSYSIF